MIIWKLVNNCYKIYGISRNISTPQNLYEKKTRVGLKDLLIGSNLEFEIQFYILSY